MSLLGHSTFKNFILIETLLHNPIVHVFVDTLNETFNKPGSIKQKPHFTAQIKYLYIVELYHAESIPYLGKDLVLVYLFSFTIDNI